MSNLTEDMLRQQRTILAKITTRRMRIAALEEEIGVLTTELFTITDSVARRIDPDLIWDDDDDDDADELDDAQMAGAR